MYDYFKPYNNMGMQNDSHLQSPTGTFVLFVLGDLKSVLKDLAIRA